MTSGEKRFARCLDKLLEDDYLCWYDVPLGRKRRYPDFIVLHPPRGILFLEVKDWKTSTIKKISQKHVDILTPSGLKTQSNPIEQARQCSYQVLQTFERDDQLKQVGGNYNGKLCFPYGYGVVFTNITRKQLDSAIPEEHRDRLLPSRLLICQDEMAPSTDAEEFQERLWGMFNYQFGEKLSLPQIDRIRWHLFPEIRIDHTQPDLFGPVNAAVIAERAIPDIVKIMDIQQEQLARSLGEGHRVVHGVAGSGKTLILGYRCLHLAETTNKPILVLCFNITLAARLRGFIKEKGLTGKVQIYHFHGWCGEQLRTYNVDLIESKSPIWERQVESVILGVEKDLIPRGQYGALLIDEGHDFEPEWLSLVSQMVDPETNSLLLLYDDAQSIYKRKSNLKFSLASVGIQAQGRTTILRLNYRNTREILDFAYQFSKEYFSDSTDADEVPLIHPESAGKHGSKPYVRAFESVLEEIDYLIRCLLKWHKDQKSWQDIAVLYPTADTGRLIFNALKKHKIPCSWLLKSQDKKDYDVDADKISLMAIPSSKGLEFETVVIVDASFEASRGKKDDNHLADDVRRLYVGFTRATEHLLVTYHRRTTLGDSLTLLSQAPVSA